MKITVIQSSIEYYYQCDEQCDNCLLRFKCYTTKWHKYKDENFFRINYAGDCYLDLLMVKAMLDGTIKLVGNRRHFN